MCFVVIGRISKSFSISLKKFFGSFSLPIEDFSTSSQITASLTKTTFSRFFKIAVHDCNLDGSKYHQSKTWVSRCTLILYTHQIRVVFHQNQMPSKFSLRICQ